jgi:hypothetical protein
MYKTDQKANMQGYQARDEDKNVLGYQADFITYYYFGGGLCRVEVAWWLQEIETLKKIQVGLEKYWGKPVKSDEGLEILSGTQIQVRPAVISWQWMMRKTRAVGISPLLFKIGSVQDQLLKEKVYEHVF